MVGAEPSLPPLTAVRSTLTKRSEATSSVERRGRMTAASVGSVALFQYADVPVVGLSAGPKSIR